MAYSVYAMLFCPFSLFCVKVYLLEMRINLQRLQVPKRISTAQNKKYNNTGPLSPSSLSIKLVAKKAITHIKIKPTIVAKKLSITKYKE